MKRKATWIIVGVTAGLLIVGVCVIRAGLQPCAWLDVPLRRSGCLTTLDETTTQVDSVAFSPDGALLAVGLRDNTVRIWRLADKALQRTFEASIPQAKSGGYSQDVAFSPDGNLLAFGTTDGNVRLWQVSDGTLAHTLEGASGKISSLAFSPNGSLLAIGTWDGPVQLWRVTEGARLQTLEGHSDGVVSVAFSPDGATLASTSLSDSVRLWNISSGDLIHELQTPAVNVAFSPDGAMLATAGAADDQKHLWSTADWQRIRDLASARGGLGAMVFSPDDALVAAGNSRYEVRWWRVTDGALLRSVKGHTDSVNSVAFSPDGKVLASGSLDGEVKLWGMTLTTSRSMTHETNPLDGTHWSLVSLQGHHPIEGTRVTLHFADGFIQGSAGCNDYRPLIIDSDDKTYQYRITRDDPPIEGTAESGALTIPNFIITEKDCSSPEGVMQQEHVYVETLRDAAAYRIINERLEIDTAQGETILVFTQEDK